MASMWQENQVDNNGVTLYSYRTGGDKPPVLLAHGITDSGLCWSRLARALETKYDLVMVDARGHGLSDRAETYLPQDHVADLMAVMKELCLVKPALIGHSMGAVNAAYLAASYPDALSCLVLEDPPWPDTPESIQRDEDAWRRTIAVERTRTLEDIMATGQLANPTWDEAEFPAWAEAKRQVAPGVVTWLDGGQSLNSWRKVIPKVTCPTLLITGDKDVRVTPDVAQEAQRLCPTLEVASIANAGHSVRRDQLEAYLKAVGHFLDRHLT